MQQRYMTDDEKESHFQTLLTQIRTYGPDEIIGVARSGCALAQWCCEELNLPLGFFEPNTRQFVCRPYSQRFVFVDDNCVSGQTYLDTKRWFENTQKGEMQWAVFFSDKDKTPERIRRSIMQGVELDYYALGPIFSTREQPKPYVRSRDEIQNCEK